MICLLVALRWRLWPREESMMLGCLDRGYMVLPASAYVREKLSSAARKTGTPVDGRVLPDGGGLGSPGRSAHPTRQGLRPTSPAVTPTAHGVGYREI